MILLVLGVLLPGLLLAFGGWLLYQLLRQNGRILRRLETLERQVAQPARDSRPAPGPPPGLPVGARAPDFRLASLAGGDKKLSDWRGRRALLIFFNPRCGFCSRMVPDLAALPVDPVGDHPLPLVVTSGSAEENRRLVAEHGLRCPVLLQEGGELAARYRAAGTPMGYLLDEEGRIASEMAVGAEALLALAGTGGPAEHGTSSPGSAAPGSNGRTKHRGNRSLSESRLNRSGLAAGTAAPPFRVPRLDGGELCLEEYRGERVLLVFSDPHCGPCDALAPRLQQAGHERPEVRILMVSRGDAETNRRKVAELGLTFPVGLQRQWEVSKRYAMFATPVAYLIDAQGRTATEVAVGVEPILGLLTSVGSPGRAGGRAGPRGERAAVRA
jgi:peroxiredoxin